MAVGIKIRELDSTSFVAADDVFLVDSPNPMDSGLSYTKNITYSDLIVRLNEDLDIPVGEAESGDVFMLTQGEPVVLKVTVGPKTVYNRFYDESPDVCFYLNGKEAPAIIMSPDRTYRFDLSELPEGQEFLLWPDRDASLFPVSPVANITRGPDFLDYKASYRYEKLFYSGERFSYMGNIMYNMDAEVSLGPDDFITIKLNKIDTLENKVNQVEASLNQDIQTVQLDTNTLQSTQINNNQTLLSHTEDIGDLELEIQNLKNQITSMNNLISQMNNHLTDMGLVIETE